MELRITGLEVYLIEAPVKGNVADATRKVETIGYVITVVHTNQGLSGLGLTYNEVGGEAIREFTEQSIAPVLLGRSPLETEALWEEMFHHIRGVGRKGLAFCAYSAVDIALWDIKGKYFGVPLYTLLGGRGGEVPIYASGGWTSYSTEELVAESRAMVLEGYRNIKIKVGVENGRNPKEDLRRVRAIRDALGPDVGIMLDANNVWQSGTAIQAAASLRELDILFLEEPVMADDIPGLARVRSRCDIPIASGEHEYTRFGARDLIAAEAVDIVQCDVTRCGGFTEMLKIIGMTQAWNLAFAPHGMEYMHMHLVASAPNALYLERLLMFEIVSQIAFLNPPQPADGKLALPEGPGLGLELDMASIRQNCRG